MKIQQKARKSDLNLGLVAAVGATAIFMLVIGWFVLRGSPTVASAGPGGGTDGAGPEEVIPDITDIAGVRGGKMYVELPDKNNPDRLVGILEAESFEPVGPNERTVEQPTAWFYLSDGRFAYMEAARGRFFMPTPNTAPESGMLQGAKADAEAGTEATPVRIRVFEKTADGERPDAETMPPLMTMEFDEPVEFDLRHARVSSTGAFRVWSPELEFRGRHLTAMVNQVRGRLELLEVRYGEWIKYTPLSAERRAELDRARGVVRDEDGGSVVAQGQPGADSDAGEATRSINDRRRGAPAGERVAAAPAEGVAEDALAAKIDHYRAVFSDGVEVTHRTNRITADALDLFVRMIDNQLPEDAIAELQFATADAGAAPAGTPAEPQTAAPRAGDAGGADPVLAMLGGSPGPDADEVAEAPSLASADDAETAPIVLRWTGPLQILPIAGEAPAELARDDLMLRMTAEQSGLVQFGDSESGANGRAVALDYGLTRGELVSSGAGGNVVLAMPGSGELTASRMHTNLKTGDIHVRGPGVMSVDQGDASGTQRQQIRWSEQADFAFAVVNDKLTSDLLRAAFAGDVQASDGDASLEGAFVDATFVASARGSRRLASLDVEEARADDGNGGTLAGDVLRMEFGEGTLGHEMDPRRIVATGSVRGARDGASVLGGSMIATVERGLDGDLTLSHVLLEDAVEYRGADGTFASGELVDVDAIGEVIRVAGAPARVGQNATGISGPEIVVDGRNRRARVMGEGSFEHVAMNDAGEPSDVLATWSEGMSFDDYGGRVEAYGNASVVSRPDAQTRDLVSAERVLIELTPFESAGGAESAGGGDMPRQLVRATAFGTTDPTGAAKPASVESRVYDKADPERVAQLFYLEGMQLVADNERGRLTVPGAGKLLILDRKESGASEPEPTGAGGVLAELAQAGPGLTRFEWRGGMTMERETGAATMRRTVRVRHKNLLAGDFTELHCEKLTARIQETGPAAGSGTPDAVKGELTQAEAAGAVYFKSGDRELIADRLLYDALGGRAIATAAPGNLVSLFDATRGTPISSRAISWDLVRDRIEIERLSPVVTPGNLP
ncbi:MAG: hypothetical protein DHS20C14_20550 [Phycisphaeraceae bacterium]|nr:MAG: hypothetical protein DHS20C14_20550 [Phycisphaeraceae bacterium]